jgi:hypothetical protein
MLQFSLPVEHLEVFSDQAHIQLARIGAQDVLYITIPLSSTSGEMTLAENGTRFCIFFYGFQSRLTWACCAANAEAPAAAIL